MDTVKILEHIHIFNGVSPEGLNLIAQLCEYKQYKANDLIFVEKSKGEEIYIINKGKVVIELGIKGKKDYVTIHRLGNGDIFGELVLVSKGDRSASARCEADCEVIAINRDDLLGLLNKHSEIGYIVMKNMASLLATRLRKTDLQLLACFLWE